MDEPSLVGLDTAALLREAYRADSWSGDDLSPSRAHALSLFCCAAYRHLPQFELADSRRVKLLPSSYTQALAGDDEFIAQDWGRAGAFWESEFGADRADREQPSIETIITRYLVMVLIRFSRVTVVAIRGTVDMLDFAIDVDDILHAVEPTNDPARLHLGLFSAAAECSVELASKLPTHPDSRIFLTGHSLGGGIAAMYRALPRFLGNAKVTQCVTFGMPRHGNRRAIQRLPQPSHICFEPIVDCIPTLPPASHGYVDVDANHRRYLEFPAIPRSRRCAHAGPRPARGMWGRAIRRFEGHLIEHYACALECLSRQCHPMIWR